MHLLTTNGRLLVEQASSPHSGHTFIDTEEDVSRLERHFQERSHSLVRIFVFASPGPGKNTGKTPLFRQGVSEMLLTQWMVSKRSPPFASRMETP
jgi:hypothetical protein